MASDDAGTPTMQDYLDADADDSERDTSDESASGSPWPYDRNLNDNGTAQRCRYCGEEFPTSGRRNYSLNVHEANCEERDES